MALRPSLLTKGLSSASGPSDTGSPAEQRDDAKKNMLKAMRPLPTQHYWNVYFDRLASQVYMTAFWAVADGFADSKRTSKRRQMELTQRPWSNLAHRSSPFRIFGGTTTTHR
jgi:hypothetical protein